MEIIKHISLFKPKAIDKKFNSLSEYSAEYLKEALKHNISDWCGVDGIGEQRSVTRNDMNSEYAKEIKNRGYSSYVEYMKSLGYGVDSTNIKSEPVTELLKYVPQEYSDTRLGKFARKYCGASLRVNDQKYVGGLMNPKRNLKISNDYLESFGNLKIGYYWINNRFEQFKMNNGKDSDHTVKSSGLENGKTFEEINEVNLAQLSPIMKEFVVGINKPYERNNLLGLTLEDYKNALSLDSDGKRYSVDFGDVVEFHDDSEYQGRGEYIPYGTRATHNGNIKTNNYTYSSLLKRTSEEFYKYGTTIPEYFKAGTVPLGRNKFTMSNTTNDYGVSHGRNLLLSMSAREKNIKDRVSGFENPYCRVWTINHGYSEFEDLIRHGNPVGKKDSYKDKGLRNDNNYSSENSERHWEKRYGRYGTMAPNGLVRITPDYTTQNPKSNIKRYMFSIENLAWKDNTIGLSEEQKGPNGGRIMWFPPYGLSFNEQVNVNWTEHQFIGRGEAINSYTNTKRGGTLKFIVLIDHPSEINLYKERFSGHDFDDTQDGTDYDLLRYFAGCGDLETDNKILPKNVLSNKQKRSGKSVGNTDSPDRVLSLNVYFPNNYTGMHNKYNGEDENDDFNVYSFCNYMIHGIGSYNDESGNCYTDEIYGFVGYEISNVTGCTTGHCGISSGCVQPNNENGGVECICDGAKIYGQKTHDGNWSEYTYRVDTYYDQKWKTQYLTENNYKFDDTSFGLNHDIGGDVGFTARELLGLGWEVCMNHSATTYGDILQFMEKVESIECVGCASKDGTTEKNKKLAEDRSKMMKLVLEKIGFRGDITTSISEENDKYGKGLNSIDSKKHRRCEIKFHLKEESSTIVSQTESVSGLGSEESEETTPRTIEVIKHDRYDDEYRFFSSIEERDKLYYKRILENVKFFNPAFHSITPEGFNARLTFLQQCCRQGPTDLRNSNNSYLGKNLAFGRPPICVLRIGDFYNTRIKVENISIEYGNNGVQYDLNPEGIGVQPMLATVSLTFTFLGGSDLGGPIPRLQNAVSFNYYANASMYDNRADIVDVDGDKEKFFKGEDPNLS